MLSDPATRMPKATASPWSRPVAEPGQCLHRMAHRVTVVEDRAAARLALVTGDDARLERAAAADQVGRARRGRGAEAAVEPLVDEVGQRAAATIEYFTISANADRKVRSS